MNKCKALLHRWTNYEFWPSSVFYAIIFPYLAYWAIRTKSLVYFTNVNPLLPDSGMINYSKSYLASHLPQELRPHLWLIYPCGKVPVGLTYPLVAKPDCGERGKGVEVVHSQKALEDLLLRIDSKYILESYISLPQEAGVFYVKPPHGKARITSLTFKDFLKVKGDGSSTVLQLMSMDPRAAMQVHRQPLALLESIPALNEEVIIEPIGNHNRGTRFINANHLINEDLLAVFDNIVKDIPKFTYGRFDIRYLNWEDLCQGKNFKIIELNGVNSEPTHIYDQATGLLQSIKDLCNHWAYIGKLSISQRHQGFKPMSLFQFYLHYNKNQKFITN